MWKLLPILLLTLPACRAMMVVSPGSTLASKYAPTNEASRPGVVKYLNEGAASIRKARRDDAYRMMYESCGGAYSIVSEEPRSEGGAAMPVGDSLVYANSQVIYIEYRCGGK